MPVDASRIVHARYRPRLTTDEFRSLSTRASVVVIDDRAVPQPRTDAGVATAEAGLVLLDGPDGVALTLTPQAAALTGQSLIDAAAEAERQARADPEDTPSD
jgi:hypothetical protein